MKLFTVALALLLTSCTIRRIEIKGKWADYIIIPRHPVTIDYDK